jgi:5'-phosphate synthase pdxT subunit
MIGVLDLQGDVVEHLDHLDRLGVPNRRIKEAAQLEGMAGLILPGGESTCLSRLIRIFEIDRGIRLACQQGMKVWGTCAGAILLATTVIGEAPHLALIDMEIERNGFGSQLDSFTREALIPAVSSSPLPLAFIRAPKIHRVGPGVSVLLSLDDYIAAAESEAVLITVFHPELTPSLALHRYFAEKCGISAAGTGVESDERIWTPTSWTRYARIAPANPFTVPSNVSVEAIPSWLLAL